MTEQPATVEEIEIVRRAIARLRTGVLATVFGLFAGTCLFVATAWLLIRGGENVGEHLGLLANYFPGYRVTWPGAVIGFFYGVTTGAVSGAAVGWIYNRIALRRPR